MVYKIGLIITLCLILGVGTVTDCLYRKIWLPLLPPIVVGILVCLHGLGEPIGWSILRGLLWGACFLGMGVVTGGQLEKGDGLILGIMAMALGFWRYMAFLFLSFFFAFVGALFLVVVRKKKRTYKMPLLPFLSAGYLILLLVGGSI